MTTRAFDPNERVRENVNMMKRVRGISAAELADLAGYTSRQVVADRLVGRTDLSVRDLFTLADALRVDPAILIGDASALMRWLADNPEHQAPAPATVTVVEPKAPARKRTPTAPVPPARTKRSALR